jgi:antitoxin MazE
MFAQVSRWGNSQGIRISKKMLEHVGIELNDEVEIIAKNNTLVIKPAKKKTIDWYLEGYERPEADESWEDIEPKGREVW